jgi:hypothetical protein
LLNQKTETFFVDFNQPAWRFGDRARAARHIVQQRHFAEHAAGTEGLDKTAFDQQFDFTFDQYSQIVAGTPSLNIAVRLKGECVFLLRKMMVTTQLPPRCANMKL